MVLLQGNLKSTIVVYSSDSLPVPTVLPGADLHQLQEDQALQHLFKVNEDVKPVLHRPRLFLSFLPVSFHILVQASYSDLPGILNGAYLSLRIECKLRSF